MSPSTSKSKRHNKAEARIFWDLRDYPIPNCLDPENIYINMELSLKFKGFHGHVSVWVYGDKNTIPSNENEWNRAGIKIISVPEVAGFDYPYVRDIMMGMDILAVQLENPRPRGLNLMVVANVQAQVAVNHIKSMYYVGHALFFVNGPASSLRIERSTWLGEIFLVSAQHVDNNQEKAEEECGRIARQKKSLECANFA